jgi:hypothetical protein
MAFERQRNFHVDRRVIEAHVEDDFGVTHIVACSVHTDRCPSCQREYPATAQGQVDFDALVQQVCEEYSAEVDRVMQIFELHGADMTKFRNARAARLAVPTPEAIAIDGSQDPGQ